MLKRRAFIAGDLIQASLHRDFCGIYWELISKAAFDQGYLFLDCKLLFIKYLYRTAAPGITEKTMARRGARGIAYALIRIMFFIIISGALTLSSAVTLAFLALRAPEAYETEHGLQIVQRTPKQRNGTQLSEALVQAR